ncbi:thiamine phosphate synthase [Sphingobacteriaceae bacterium]|nr:thiamine phosphate synthase [Sphingobacteriaceae bacterium]
MKISGGIYLIADVVLDKHVLLTKITEALRGGVKVLQLYNTEKLRQEFIAIIQEICDLCHGFDVPVLVNNNWKLLNEFALDGVHFDTLPADFLEIQNQVTRKFLKGITCSNDLEIVHMANKYKFDYISFCSMFPSDSAAACEIVSFSTVQKARLITSIPFFAAGGIRLENLVQLMELPLQGIAVISGIMQSPTAEATAEEYVHRLKQITTS